MAFTHRITVKWETEDRSLQQTKSFEASAQVSICEVVASDAGADYEIDLVLDVSEIKAIYICSSQDVLLEINDGAGGGGSLSLKANEPYEWDNLSLLANLLGTDITALFVTNDSGEAATFELECLYDATP